MSKKNVEWEWKKLGDVCEIVSGRNQKAVEVPNGKYPIYGSGGEMGRANSFICPAGCTIVGRKGSINNPIFVNEPFWNVDTAFGFSPKKNCNSFFLFYFCKSFDFYSMNKGTTIPSLVKADLLEISIPIPPLDEQERIVKVLDDAFEKIEAIKTTAETNLQNAKDLFQTTLANELSITDEKIKQGWTSKNIGDIAEIKGGKRIPRGEKLLTEVTKHPYIRVTDFNENGSVDLDDIHYISDEIYEGIKRYIITTDDAYVSIAGTIGKCGIVPPELNNANLTENACRLIFNNCLYNRFFVYFSLGNEFKELTQKESRANAMPKLSISRLSQIKISVPPLPIQKQIVAKLDSLSEKVKQLESNYKQVLADCDELKKAILKKAFNGEL